MDKKQFVERILETENLTDQLEDAEANLLLDWGTAQLDRVLQGTEDEEVAGGRVNVLMAAMRKINRILGGLEDASPESLEEDLTTLSGLISSALGTEYLPNLEEIRRAAARLPGLRVRLALEFLVAWGSQAASIE